MVLHRVSLNQLELLVIVAMVQGISQDIIMLKMGSVSSVEEIKKSFVSKIKLFSIFT